MKIVKPSVVLVHSTPHPERVIERMGRICYQSNHKVLVCSCCGGKGRVRDPSKGALSPYEMCCFHCDGTGTDISSAIAFVKMVIANGHESVIEHASAGFSIITDRGVTHEIVRHRLASYSQESTRYCDYNGERFGGELSFIEPPGLATEPNEDAFSGAPLPSCRELWLAGIMMTEQTYKQLRQEDLACLL